jgi:hypothetical protein
MLFIPLLRKEVHWSKRNLVVLGFLLLLVPVAFGMTSVAFQETVPENVDEAGPDTNETFGFVIDGNIAPLQDALVYRGSGAE